MAYTVKALGVDRQRRRRCTQRCRRFADVGENRAHDADSIARWRSRSAIAAMRWNSNSNPKSAPEASACFAAARAWRWCSRAQSELVVHKT